MGYRAWDSSSWASYSVDKAKKSTSEIFSSRTIHTSMDPKGIGVREARDSDLHPASTPIIVALDVTGSMGHIADHMARKALGTLVEETLARKPVPDPQILFAAIGDIDYDSAPFQVGQFESDITMTRWLESIYLEHGGGGNNYESYILGPYFAAFHTATDAWDKRQQKGFLFTIGDEMPSRALTRDDVERIFGTANIQTETSYEDIVATASKLYHYYHIIVAEGNYASSALGKVKERWTEILGQNALVLKDHTKVAELIVSTLELNAGKDLGAVASSWDGATAMVVKDAFAGALAPKSSGGVARL